MSRSSLSRIALRSAVIGAGALLIVGVTACAGGQDSPLSGTGIQQKSERTQQQSSPSAPAVQREVTGEDITAIGDSVMLASADALEQEYPGIDIHADVSKQLRDAASQIEQLKAEGTLRDVIVIGLGINGVGGAGSARDAIAAADGRMVIFVDVHGPGSYTEGVNDALTSVSEETGAGLARWNEAISDEPNLLARDGVHPGDAGAKIYAQTVRTAIEQLL